MSFTSYLTVDPSAYPSASYMAPAASPSASTVVMTPAHASAVAISEPTDSTFAVTVSPIAAGGAGSSSSFLEKFGKSSRKPILGVKRSPAPVAPGVPVRKERRSQLQRELHDLLNDDAAMATIASVAAKKGRTAKAEGEAERRASAKYGRKLDEWLAMNMAGASDEFTRDGGRRLEYLAITPH